MKKNILIIMLSVILAAVFAAQPAAQAASNTAKNSILYISEIKIGVGETAEEAANALKDYTILSDNGKNVNLNKDAGGGIGSKGDRVVYLGYKMTTDRSEAITDLAVMNMKGGYSVKDYELLMEQYMTEQIIPFVDGFLAAIKEYRENYNSDNIENKARAKYVHDALNKLTDDDCGDAGLGDLLLNETKYEMGDEAYESLSEDEKKQHADILTIIAQANGKAILLLENLITRAADTNEDTWIDRFTSTTYDELLSLYPDMLPTDAANELAKEYDNDAQKILSMWSALNEQLDSFDKKMERLEELKQLDLSWYNKQVEEFDAEKATDKEMQDYIMALAQLTAITDEMTALYADIVLGEYLKIVEYKDGTLFDFFTCDYQTVKNDITVLYPLVASLSAGQRAGLEFVTLGDLIMLAATGTEGYKDAQTDSLVKTSIYEGVNREIYQKGGVALTSEALRAHAAEEIAADKNKLSLLSDILLGVAGASVIAFSVAAKIKISQYIKYSEELDDIEREITQNGIRINEAKADLNNGYKELLEGVSDNLKENKKTLIKNYSVKSSFTSRLLLGFTIVMVALSAVALYFSYRDLVDYYNVDYTPIPKYMVDEKDITVYNEKGEKTVIKNLAAYYKAVETNRAESDEWYGILGTSADLNGTVGRQWLALYAAKNENMSPIVADSLKVVVGSDEVPADYTAGIHMFGSDSAYNLNNTQLVWNNEAKSVYVYFAVDTSASGSVTTGSSFTAGYIVISAVIGLILGAAAAACITVFVYKKRRETK